MGFCMAGWFRPSNQHHKAKSMDGPKKSGHSIDETSTFKALAGEDWGNGRDGSGGGVDE